MTKSLRILAFLIGVSMGFTQLALPGLGRTFSLSFLLIALYAILLLPKLVVGFSGLMKRHTLIVICPILFYVVLIVSNVLHYHSGQKVFDMTILSCIVLFLCLLIHAHEDSRMIQVIMVGYGIGTILLAILGFLGIGVHYVGGERLSLFGANSNGMAHSLFMGSAIIANVFILQDVFRIGKWRFLFLIPIVMATKLVLESGSRSGLILMFFLLIMLIFTIPTETKGVKILVVLFGLAASCYLFILLLSSDTVIGQRMLAFINEHDSAGRADIWRVYVPYILDNPILGIGQTGRTYASDTHFGAAMREFGGMSPHNVIIEVALFTGLVGLSIMLIFWTTIFHYCMQIWKKYKQILPLLLFSSVAIRIVSGHILEIKDVWLIFAYIVTWIETHEDDTEEILQILKDYHLLNSSNLLFITDTYYPDSGATTTIVKRTAEALVARGYEVDVYPTEISGRHYSYPTTCEGVRILAPTRVADVKDVMKKKEYGAVFSAAVNFEVNFLAHEAIQGSGCAWYPMSYDPYAFDPHISAVQKKVYQQREIAALKDATRIFLLSEFQQDYAGSPIEDKITYFHLPCIRDIEQDAVASPIAFDPNYINCVFLGDFYYGVENTDFIFRLFESLGKKIRFYTIGNPGDYQATIAKWQARLGERYVCLPRITQQQAHGVMFQSDVLVSMGHDSANMCPSKVIDFVASGKPILHIAKIPDCCAQRYLQPYENKYCLYQGEKLTEDKIAAVQAFIESAKGQPRMPFEQVLKRYPDFTMEVLIEKILNELNNNL